MLDRVVLLFRMCCVFENGVILQVGTEEAE